MSPSRKDSTHIKQIKVVSNTHWDREFKWSFEKTRRHLLDMMDTTLDILESDPQYHSYTMDSHSIMIEDYLEIRPERREQVERLIQSGRLIIGPWYTLSEDYSILHESLIRNLLWGRKVMDKYSAPCGTVAYKPASWGQSGQLPQILDHFGLDKIMFYRGISHHEADAEWVWEGVDGTRMLASRFALFARYNWYYLVHRPVTRNCDPVDKMYKWADHGEVPFRFADSLEGENVSFGLKSPEQKYHPEKLKSAVREMVAIEAPHFTTEVFLAMHGHDISVAHPLESKIIADAQKALGDQYSIEHTDLESYWKEMEKHLDEKTLPVLKGERRSYLKEGQWTYLLPSTISARTYLKQQDFRVYIKLAACAEPLTSLALALGGKSPRAYLDRGWQLYLTNHTHDANGGCAPDSVSMDMESRYRQASDVADILTEDAMSHIAKNLSPENLPSEAMQLVVFNPLAADRDAIVEVDLEIPSEYAGSSVLLKNEKDPDIPIQPILSEPSGTFMENIWDVPTILNSKRMKFYAQFKRLPSLGYRTYLIEPQTQEIHPQQTLVTGINTLENCHMTVKVNPDGTVDLLHKSTGRLYESLNYLTDEGECGNAWMHKKVREDRKYSSLGTPASVSVTASGPLVSTICAEFNFAVPQENADDAHRSRRMVDLPVKMEYRLEKDSELLKVTLTVDNRAKDHWLRANFPTGIETKVSWTDAHFDVMARPIEIPDCTGWVEQALGTQPMQTFADLTDGKCGFGLLSRGLYEYEAFDDQPRTLALTLIRACRIRLMVSEEKSMELPDIGIQCPGLHTFEYAICPHQGDWSDAALPAKSADYNSPVRAAMTGRGKGSLPLESGFFTLDNSCLVISAVKPAEDDSGIIIRFYNPMDTVEKAKFEFGCNISNAHLCKMDETRIEEIQANGNQVYCKIEPKKIMTLLIHFSVK